MRAVKHAPLRAYFLGFLESPESVFESQLLELPGVPAMLEVIGRQDDRLEHRADHSHG
jgi:hypothetical protein